MQQVNNNRWGDPSQTGSYIVSNNCIISGACLLPQMDMANEKSECESVSMQEMVAPGPKTQIIENTEVLGTHDQANGELQFDI